MQAQGIDWIVWEFCVDLNAGCGELGEERGWGVRA